MTWVAFASGGIYGWYHTDTGEREAAQVERELSANYVEGVKIS